MIVPVSAMATAQPVTTPAIWSSSAADSGGVSLARAMLAGSSASHSAGSPAGTTNGASGTTNGASGTTNGASGTTNGASGITNGASGTGWPSGVAAAATSAARSVSTRAMA